jgi:hypothetical protein
MAWVWYARLDTDLEAEFDPSSPVHRSEALSDAPLDLTRGPAKYRSTAPVDRFKALHCPPVGPQPAVDEVWQSIISKFVPTDLVQFYPIELKARGGVCRRFSWVIPFSRVRCIDPLRSDVTIKEEKPTITYILDANYYVHLENCLGALHLARDEQQKTHIVLSAELRNALAATGESSMFYTPENLPLTYRQVH